MISSVSPARTLPMDKPVEQSCFWLANRNKSRTTESLSGKHASEIVIVGAGFTGLWTAHFLKALEPTIDIAVIKQGCTGYGGSGRNAGMISACIDHSHSLAINHFGEEEAARLAAIGLRNIAELAEFAADCDLELNGQLHVALSDSHLEDCKAFVETARRLGLDGYRFLDAKATRSELNSALFKGSAFAPGGGIINPIKLIDKLVTELSKSGVRIFEQSRVTAIEDHLVRCVEGSVSCKSIVLATDSYSHHLFPSLLQYYIPLYDYVVVSEPLSEAQLSSIGWANRQGVTDCRNFFNYYRLTADNRILWGTSEAMYFGNNRVDSGCDHSGKHYESLLESFLRHFPDLRDLSFPYAWGGPIASTTRLTPFFGTLNAGSVYYGLGYTGHGIGTTRLAGNVLAHMVLSKHSDLLKMQLVQKKPFPYPPEPIRNAAVNMVTRSLKRVDSGKSPDLLLNLLDLIGIGFSS